MFSGAYTSKACRQSVYVNYPWEARGAEVCLTSREFQEDSPSMARARVRRASWWRMATLGQTCDMRDGLIFSSLWALWFCFPTVGFQNVCQRCLRTRDSPSLQLKGGILWKSCLLSTKRGVPANRGLFLQRTSNSVTTASCSFFGTFLNALWT